MIKSFEITKYRQFENAKFDNFSNINLFIGENDTGKTTILKFLYVKVLSLNTAKSRTGCPLLYPLSP